MDDYKSSAVRHYNDADKLNKSESFDNAGHLIGIAVECALKHKLSSSTGMSIEGHIPHLLQSVKRQLNSRNDSPLISVLSSPVLHGWHINDRYRATGTTTEQQVSNWFQDAKKIFRNTGVKK